MGWAGHCPTLPACVWVPVLLGTMPQPCPAFPQASLVPLVSPPLTLLPATLPTPHCL